MQRLEHVIPKINCNACARPNKHEAKKILRANLPWTTSFQRILLQEYVTCVEGGIVIKQGSKLLQKRRERDDIKTSHGDESLIDLRSK